MNRNLKWLVLVVVFPLLTFNILDSYGCYNIDKLTNGWYEERISDGILTYSIDGDVELSYNYNNIIDKAFDEWSEKLDHDITFEKSNSFAADIIIKPTNENIYPTPDMKEIYPKGVSHVSSTFASINIYGETLDTITKLNPVPIESMFKNVIRHEIGHVLGLGHSDEVTSLMFYLNDDSSYEIDSCLVDKVKELNFD